MINSQSSNLYLTQSLQKEPRITKSHACLVRDSLAHDCSWDANRLRTSFNSAAKDTTFRRKLCFFSFKSFNKGSISLADDESGNDDDTAATTDEEGFSTIDMRWEL